MTASFFANSSNVKISGGEFNVVHGNYTVFDQSRHTHNTNSFNTTNNTTIGSHNDDSQQFYGGQGRSPPYPRGSGPETARGYGAPSNAPFPNGQYFPPQTVHPGLMGGATHLPPGSTVKNIDSLNTAQTVIDGAYNDNSRAYNVPLATPPRPRNPNVGPQANPYQQQYAPHAQPADQSRYGNPSPTDSARNERGTPAARPWSGGHNPSGAEYYAHNLNASHQYGRGGMGGQYVYGANIRYGDGRRNGPAANFAPGNVHDMPPEMGEAFNTLMKGVAKMTAPDPADAQRAADDSSDSDEAGSDASDDSRRARDLRSLPNGVNKLSLADPPIHPSFSRVKSDPQIPMQAHESISRAMDHSIPVHSESMPEVPQHMKEGVIMGQAPPTFLSAAPPGGYSRTPQPTSPSSTSSAQSPLAQFGLDDKPNAIQGSAVFNTFNGNLNKYDNRHHITNIDSGNTQNNLVKDSYNDNSIQSFAAAAPVKSSEKEKKKTRRFW